MAGKAGVSKLAVATSVETCSTLTLHILTSWGLAVRIPNSSEVSLAETVQSSYFLPRHDFLSISSRKCDFACRCAQKSLRFGQRRSARRHGPN